MLPVLTTQWWELALYIAQFSSPTVMKFLQWASTRRDMFPASFCDRFEAFHEHAPMHSWTQTQDALKTAFGEAWNDVLTPGYVPGDTAGNLVLASHLLFAVAVTVGGLLQLLPRVRQRWPRFHRWNGRVFIVSALVAAIGGLVMVWTRKTGGDLSQTTGLHVPVDSGVAAAFLR